MKLKHIIAAAIFASTASAYADAPSEVRIKSIEYAGSGCPAGSVAENVSTDKQAFTLLFDSFIAEAGPGVPLREKRKNCQLLVDLEFPQGWTYTIASIDHRGYASLEKKVVGIHKASYYFQGQGQSGTLETKIKGEKDDDYHLRDLVGLSALVWAPCGARRALNINTQIQVDNSANKRAAGLMTVDSVDGQLTQIFHLKWERCRR
jgi:hypothetical protein